MPWIKFDEIEKKEKKVTKKVTEGINFIPSVTFYTWTKEPRWMNRWHCPNPAHRRKRGCSTDFLYAFGSMSENSGYDHGSMGTIGYPVRKQLLPTATLCQCGGSCPNQRQLEFLPDLQSLTLRFSVFLDFPKKAVYSTYKLPEQGDSLQLTKLLVRATA